MAARPLGTPIATRTHPQVAATAELKDGVLTLDGAPFPWVVHGQPEVRTGPDGTPLVILAIPAHSLTIGTAPMSRREVRSALRSEGA